MQLHVSNCTCNRNTIRRNKHNKRPQWKITPLMFMVSMAQVQRSFHQGGMSAQSVPELTQTDSDGPLTWDTPSSAALQPENQGGPTPLKYSVASGVPSNQGERGFISSSELQAAPLASRPNPKVALIMYSQAAIISTRDQLWPCSGKQKDVLRLTAAVSICEVYWKLKTMPPTKQKQIHFMFWFLFTFLPTHKLSQMHQH